MKILVLLIAVFAFAHADVKPILDGRIVGGHYGDIADFPYQLSLRMNGRHDCGASIIGDRWALTAAHCLENRYSFQISFRAGSSLSESDGLIVDALILHIHPLYKTSTSDYDVGLVHTKTKFAGIHMEPIVLPKSYDLVPVGRTATVSGWGRIYENGPLPAILKYTYVRVVDQDVCSKALKYYGGVTDSMFCASGPDTDSCQGDSGGPIVINDVQVGLVSWGIGCADPSYPGVYAKLSHPRIRSWIKDTAHI